MAFNLQTFRTRALTAIIFAVVMIAGLFWNEWTFLLLFSIIHFGCWWEYLRLMEKIFRNQIHIYCKFGFMFLGYGIMLLFCTDLWAIDGFRLDQNISLPFSLAGFILLIIGIFRTSPIKPYALGAAVLGIAYISLAWGLMLNLYREIVIHKHDAVFELSAGSIPIIIIFSIWINDTMAYIVGSFIGKNPLSKISPKKTWEGTIGGIILCVLVIALAIPAIWIESFAFKETAIFLAIISFVSAVAGTLGDLLESKLKRMAGVKDSGRFMPGHGGFLDRFDSLLLATPFVWLLIFVAKSIL
jgi:phosphatidate cytidylyltransferase